MTKCCLAWFMVLSLCACSGDKQVKTGDSGSSGTLQGTALFQKRQFPSGSKMVAVLDRAVPSNRTWELVDRFETPLSAPPVSFTLHYQKEPVEDSKVRLRVWGEDPEGTLLLAAEAHPVELPATQPVGMRLRYVGQP